MKTMQFKQTIQAPAEKVYDTMIGRETFKQWTSVFNPSSDYQQNEVEGSWAKGSKILFIGTDKNGKREGMVGYIREHIPARHVSIEYAGILDGNNELTDGPVAEEWHGFENYTFEEHDGATIVTVDLDVNDEMIDYFGVTYPKALNKLKEICEV